MSGTQNNAMASRGELGEELLERYMVLGEVGRGGCAVVYEGVQIATNRIVALKVLTLPVSLPASELNTVSKRFIREARLIQKLRNPHIVECLDFGSYEGRPCMVLEFVDGNSLDDIIRKNAPLDAELAVSIILQVLDALSASHENGVIHRDIKPSNIMVLGEAPHFQVKVLDFGIASMLEGMEDGNTLLTQVGSIRGTPSYMAPELFSGGQKASPSSDVYAAGLLLMECFTGKVTYNGDNLLTIAYDQVNKKLEIPSSVPPLLAQVIKKMCDKREANRYSTAEQAAQALTEACENLDNRSLNTLLVVRSAVVRKRFWILAALIVALLCVVLGVFWKAQHSPDSEATRFPQTQVPSQGNGYISIGEETLNPSTSPSVPSERIAQSLCAHDTKLIECLGSVLLPMLLPSTSQPQDTISPDVSEQQAAPSEAKPSPDENHAEQKKKSAKQKSAKKSSRGSKKRTNSAKKTSSRVKDPNFTLPENM